MRRADFILEQRLANTIGDRASEETILLAEVSRCKCSLEETQEETPEDTRLSRLRWRPEVTR